jgi:alpha-tubulin suppressor-like RCC1 family protein
MSGRRAWALLVTLTTVTCLGTVRVISHIGSPTFAPAAPIQTFAQDIAPREVRGGGTVWTWSVGRAPTPWSQFDDVTAVVKTSHVLALRSDGTVWAWGSNASGELGTGQGPCEPMHCSSVQVTDLGGVTAIEAGTFRSLALRSDGTVWAWGQEVEGGVTCLGRPCSNRPVLIGGLNEIVSISAGSMHNLALRSDGTVWSWGGNEMGQLGDGTSDDRREPVRVVGLTDVRSIAANWSHSLALRSDGTVWAWGANESAQLGSTVTEKDVPPRTSGGCRHGGACSRIPLEVIGLPSAIAVAAGGNHSLALLADGGVWGWGSGGWGQLGSGADEEVCEIFRTRCRPIPISDLAGGIAISAGLNSSIALGSDGSVWEWGREELTRRLTPTQVVGLSGIIAISATSYQGYAAATGDGPGLLAIRARTGS